MGANGIGSVWDKERERERDADTEEDRETCKNKAILKTETGRQTINRDVQRLP